MRRLQLVSLFVVVGFSLAGAFGCADSRSASQESTPLAESESAQSGAEVAGEEPAKQGGDDATTTELSEIDWEAADAYKGLAISRLEAKAREAVERSPVPVLLPDDEDLLDGMHITVGEAWYAASMSGPDHTVVFNGTHRYRDIPGAVDRKEGAHSSTAEETEHMLTRTHGIVTLAFESFGVAYAVDVECENPLENKLCTDDDYVLSLVEEAGVVREDP